MLLHAIQKLIKINILLTFAKKINKNTLKQTAPLLKLKLPIHCKNIMAKGMMGTEVLWFISMISTRKQEAGL